MRFAILKAKAARLVLIVMVNSIINNNFPPLIFTSDGKLSVQQEDMRIIPDVRVIDK